MPRSIQSREETKSPIKEYYKTSRFFRQIIDKEMTL